MTSIHDMIPAERDRFWARYRAWDDPLRAAWERHWDRHWAREAVVTRPRSLRQRLHDRRHDIAKTMLSAQYLAGDDYGWREREAGCRIEIITVADTSVLTDHQGRHVVTRLRVDLPDWRQRLVAAISREGALRAEIAGLGSAAHQSVASILQTIAR